jgi:hypothetical protein
MPQSAAIVREMPHGARGRPREAVERAGGRAGRERDAPPRYPSASRTSTATSSAQPHASVTPAPPWP